MALNKKDEIDMRAVYNTTADLIMVDYLEWTGQEKDDNEHMWLMQEKINSYIEAVESGEIFDIKPEVKNKEIKIKIVSRHCINEKGKNFLLQVSDVLNSINIELVFEWRV